MARKCSICFHPRRAEIEEARLAGSSFRGIARRFAVSEDATERHAASHLSQKLAKAMAAQEAQSYAAVERHVEREELSGEALLERVLSLARQAEEILRDARADGKPGLALAAIDKAASLLELMGRCLGGMQAQTAQRVLIVERPRDLTVEEWMARYRTEPAPEGEN